MHSIKVYTNKRNDCVKQYTMGQQIKHNDSQELTQNAILTKQKKAKHSNRKHHTNWYT